MWRRIECVAVYTENMEESLAFYESLGLIKAWESVLDREHGWKLVGMRYPDGNSELVLKNDPNRMFAEVEIVVEDVIEVFNSLKSNPKIKWIREPFPNVLGGHVAVMQAPDGNVFVLVGQ